MNSEKNNDSFKNSPIKSFIFEKHFYTSLIIVAIIGVLAVYLIPFVLGVMHDGLFRQNLLWTAGGATGLLTLGASYYKTEIDKKIAEDKLEYDKESADAKLQQDIIEARRERYAKAVEQIADDKPAVRLGGVNTLFALADDWSRWARDPHDLDNIQEFIPAVFKGYGEIEEALARKKNWIPGRENYARNEVQLILNTICSYIISPYLEENNNGVPSISSAERNILKRINAEISKPERAAIWHSTLIFDFSYATFEYTLDLSNIYFFFSAHFNSSEFKGEVGFNNTNFCNKVNFGNAMFHDKAIFSNAMFRDEAIWSNAIFQGETCFEKSHFVRAAKFNDIKFKDRTIFNSSKFQNKSDFTYCVFSKELRFTSAIFEKEVNFGKSEFNGDVYFNFAKFRNDVKIVSDTDPLDIDYELSGILGETIFKGMVTFFNAEIYLALRFAYTKFLGPTNFEINITKADDEMYKAKIFGGVTNVCWGLDFSSSIFACKPVFKSADYEYILNLGDSFFNCTYEDMKFYYDRNYSNFNGAIFRDSGGVAIPEVIKVIPGSWVLKLDSGDYDNDAIKITSNDYIRNNENFEKFMESQKFNQWLDDIRK